MFSIIAVGLIHMLAAGFDQFVINVIGGSGFAHQVRFLPIIKWCFAVKTIQLKYMPFKQIIYTIVLMDNNKSNFSFKRFHCQH